MTTTDDSNCTTRRAVTATVYYYSKRSNNVAENGALRYCRVCQAYIPIDMFYKTGNARKVCRMHHAAHVQIKRGKAPVGVATCQVYPKRADADHKFHLARLCLAASAAARRLASSAPTPELE